MDLDVGGHAKVLEFMETIAKDLEDPEEGGETEPIARNVVHDLVNVVCHLSEESNNNLADLGSLAKNLFFHFNFKDETVRVKRKVPAKASVHLKHVPVSMSADKLWLSMTKYPGFMRLALSEPTVDTMFMTRKAWITFDEKSNVKDICLDLASVEHNGKHLGAVVNKELSKKIRFSSSALVHHVDVVRFHIKVASEMIVFLDNKWNIDCVEGGSKLLDHIEDHLVEVTNAEEDELLGVKKDVESGEILANLEMLRYLDQLILYLRLVHSIDFYNCHEYINEDQMPNKLGLIHVRGPVTKEKLDKDHVDEFMKDQEHKLKRFYQPDQQLTIEELQVLGLKNKEEEVEAFIKKNTQEIGSGKYLCPLSGKKFKGVEYVRKHIFSRYSAQVEKVLQNTEFFNNFVRDAQRPTLKIVHAPPPAALKNLPAPVPSSIPAEEAWRISDYNPSIPPPSHRPPHPAEHLLERPRHGRHVVNPDARPRLDYYDMDLFKNYNC